MKCHCARNVESQFPAPSSEHWYRKQAGYKTNIYTATEADCSNCIKVGRLTLVRYTCVTNHLLMHLVNAALCSSNDPSTPILEMRETSMTGTEPDTELIGTQQRAPTSSGRSAHISAY